MPSHITQSHDQGTVLDSDPRIVHGSREMGKTKTVPGESWNEDEMTRSLTVFLILINAYMYDILIHILLKMRK